MNGLKHSFLFAALALVASVSLIVSAITIAMNPTTAEAQPAGVMVYQETYDAASTIDAAGVTNVITAPGAVLGDFCVASVGVDVLDMTITCNIQAAGLAEVRMQNESGTTADLASTTWRVMVFPRGTR